MKPKFQVGDHVVVKHRGFESNYNWNKGIVTKTERIDNQRFYKVEFDADCCPPLYFTARELEHDTAWYWYKSQSKNKQPKTKAKFEIGDSVVVKNMEGISSYLNGMTGTILVVYGSLACEYLYCVKFDDGKTHDFLFKNLEHVKCGKKIQYKFKMGDNLEVIENDCCNMKGKVVKKGYDNDHDIKWYVLKQEDGKFSPELREDCLEPVKEEQLNLKFKIGDIVIVKDCGFLDGCAGTVKRISTLDSGETIYETAIGMPNSIKSVIKLREKDLRAPKYSVGYQAWGVKITDIGYVYDARHSFRDRKPAVVYTLSMSDGTIRHTVFEDRVSDEIVEYQKRLDRWCRENVEKLFNPFGLL